MKAHTSTFKENIKLLGRELDSKITYTLDEDDVELGSEQLNSITPHYEADILKSVMKQLDIDSNVDIPIGTEINYEFGLLVNGSYEYIDFGNYIVYSSEKQEDTRSYKIVAYDKMLYAMKDYQQLVSKNLFDKNNLQELNAYFSTSTATITSNTSNYTLYIPCESSTTYTITIADGGGTFAFGYTDTAPEIGTSVSGRTTNKTLTTGANATYLVCRYFHSGNATKTKAEILSSIQIEKGSSATSYRPYFNYPITLKNYLTILCDNIGLAFNDTNFVNYDKELASELYLDSDGNSLNYTYRDVLDEIAGATASTICINKDDELEVRYITATEGKNLFNKDGKLSTYTASANGSTITKTDEKISFTTTSSSSAGFYTVNNTFKTYIDDFNTSKTYTISADITTSASTNIRFGFESSPTNKVINGTERISNTSNSTSITKAFICYAFVNGIDVEISNIQIEENNVSTQYQPYGADMIDEEYLKDVNVNFGELYGPVNSIVFSRSAESDNIFRQDTESVQQNGLTEIKIVDNQILNGNNRDEFIDGVFNQLNGFSYYANDYVSTGITYYDICDRYNVKVEDNIYSCVMLNDEVLITQGLEENIHTDMPESSETDYKKADKTDRRINQAYIIVDKQNQEINSVVQTVYEMRDLVDTNNEQVEALGTRLTQTENSLTASITSIQDELDNGVGLVKTTTVTVDDSGLNVSTDNSKISTTLSNEAFTINSSDKELAFFGYDRETNSTRAEMDNLTITNYLTAGNHRIEKFERDGEARTGYFYIGGR